MQNQHLFSCVFPVLEPARFLSSVLEPARFLSSVLEPARFLSSVLESARFLSSVLEPALVNFAVVLQPWWPQPLARVPLALRDLVALAPCQRQCDHRRLKWTSANASRDTSNNDVRCNREWCRSDLKRVARCHFV